MPSHHSPAQVADPSWSFIFIPSHPPRPFNPPGFAAHTRRSVHVCKGKCAHAQIGDTPARLTMPRSHNQTSNNKKPHTYSIPPARSNRRIHTHTRTHARTQSTALHKQRQPTAHTTTRGIHSCWRFLSASGYSRMPPRSSRRACPPPPRSSAPGLPAPVRA